VLKNTLFNKMNIYIIIYQIPKNQKKNSPKKLIFIYLIKKKEDIKTSKLNKT